MGARGKRKAHKRKPHQAKNGYVTIPAGVPRQNPGQLVGLDSMTFPKMFVKHGVGGEAGEVKKGACIGRDRINQGGGFCVEGKKGERAASYLNGLRRFRAEVGAVKKVGGVSAETLWVVITTQ